MSMMSPYSVPRRPQIRQRGAILVTSLLLLMVLTVLGVAMMRMTGMQERMAGNTRDLGLALQGSEAGLRDGEGWLRLQATQPGSAATLPDCGESGICQRFGAGNVPVLPLNLEDQSHAWWEANTRELADVMADLDQPPHYVIEEAGFVRDSLLFDETAGRDFYRLTGQSSGGSGLANTVLQSTYARRF